MINYFWNRFTIFYELEQWIKDEYNKGNRSKARKIRNTLLKMKKLRDDYEMKTYGTIFNNIESGK